MATRSVRDAAADLLRRELAALAALGEAMDDSLARDGVQGRHGEPRTLVTQRLRLNNHMLRTLEAYRATDPEPVEDSLPLPDAQVVAAKADEKEVEQRSLVEEVALSHGHPTIKWLWPRQFDPESFLAAVIRSRDPSVRVNDRLRARRMLTRRTKDRPYACVCISTLRARNELQLREWIREAEDLLAPEADDPVIAALVRRLAAGEAIQPWHAYEKTEKAFRHVVEQGCDRARGVEEAARWTGEDTSVIRPFWNILLSPDTEVTAHDRLMAFAALDDEDALPRCTCSPSARRSGSGLDERRAMTIRLVAQKHLRASLHIAEYPETFLAVRDAIDARVLADLRQTAEGEESPAADL